MFDVIVRERPGGRRLRRARRSWATSPSRTARSPRVGKVDGEARRIVDAAGRVVAPGFIDPHTHFDVQLLWDGAARPALEHGVTCVVPGNCSLSLAPLKAADRPRLVGMFQQIEEMPPAAFTERLRVDLGGLRRLPRGASRRRLSINVAPLVGHSVIRLWVMGAAAQERAATPDEIAAMQDLLRECLEAGAVGLSTSFVDVDENGRPVPSRFAQFEELDALCAVLGEFGRMLQCVPEFYDTDLTIARIDQLAEPRLSTASRPPSRRCSTPPRRRRTCRASSPASRSSSPAARASGRRCRPGPIDISFSLLRPSLFFARLPRWVRILRQPLDERLAALRDPETVAKMVGDAGPDGGERDDGPAGRPRRRRRARRPRRQDAVRDRQGARRGRRRWR